MASTTVTQLGTTTQEQLTLLLGVPSDGARIALEMDGGSIGVALRPRAFKSGSDGYGAQLKVDGTDGRRYQVNVTAVRIDSGKEPVTEQRAALVAQLAVEKAADKAASK